MGYFLSSGLIVTLLASHVLGNPIIPKCQAPQHIKPLGHSIAIAEAPQYSKPLGRSFAIAEAPSSNDSIIPQSLTWTQDYLSQRRSVTNETIVMPSSNNSPHRRTHHRQAPSNTTQPSKRFIDGLDNRYELNPPTSTYPYRSIGKITWSNGIYCSGTLIGPRHVLTAKHCHIPNTPGTFSPGYSSGAPYGSASITVAITSSYEWGTPCGWKNDWMVLILNKRLGDKVGYLGATLPQKELEDRAIFQHVGYPRDEDDGEEPYRVDGSTIESQYPWDCDGAGPVYSDTDCAAGQSGGPLWQGRGVEGVEGEFVWGTLSVTIDYGGGVAVAGWAGGEGMLEAIRAARRRFP